MAKFLIKIQSASDIITNSSSEVFLCRNNTEMTIDQLIDFIFEYNRSHQFEGSWEDRQALTKKEQQQFDFSGGMGGFLEVWSYEDCKREHVMEYYFRGLDNPDNYILVDTDWCHNATINWICEHLNAKRVD